MSLRDCIDKAVEARELDRKRAEETREFYEDIRGGLEGLYGKEEAERMARQQTFDAVKFEAIEKRRQTLLAAEKARGIAVDIETFRDAKGRENPGLAFASHLDRHELAEFSNVVARKDAIRGLAHGLMDQVLATFRRDLLGRTRSPAELENLTREAFGNATGDVAAKELAKAWAAAAEFLRLQFNRAGGRIPARKDWGLPQHHDSLKVRKVSFEEWRDEVWPRLDRARMIDERTGRPMSDGQLELGLREAYESIRSEGLNSLTPSGLAVGRKLANRRLDHRFLVFETADDWLAYQKRFGAHDPFSTMLAHIDGMAGDIALMQVLGPNPAAMMRWGEQTVSKRAAELDNAAGGSAAGDIARGELKKARDMYDFLIHKTNAPIDSGFGRFFAGLRSVLTSMQLGSAQISAITDFNFQRMARQFNGLPTSGFIADTMRLMVPGKDQELAVRLGLIAENWSSVALAQSRYVGEAVGPELAQRMSDAVLRASGLSPFTQAGRWAFGMEFLGFLADQADRPFDALPKALQNTFKRYGLGAGAWDVMRSTGLYRQAGAGGRHASFLRPSDIMARGEQGGDLPPGRAQALAYQLLEMINTETEFAVPSASLRGRVTLISDQRPGTFVGELVRSTAMYKNFAVTLIHTHMSRAVHQGRQGKLGYGLDLMISTTLMGALAMQLKSLSQGKDPREMDNFGFWSAALVQGGGLGLFGDFLVADQNRFGRGLPETLAGPVVGFGGDVLRLTVGNIQQAAQGEEMGLANDAMGFARRYTPGGSLWYGRLAYERFVLDRLQLWLDPKARERFRRREQRQERDFGTRFYWRPGRTRPDRAPRLDNALGG